ncbi:MAG: tautomerase family protein [Actinomycetota bacterium]
MPFYHALVRPGLLADDAREGFANDVVEIHCGVTGAPPSFVHVLVTEDDAGRLGEDAEASIVGTIRAGRTDEQKAEMTGRMSEALARRAGVAAADVTATTRDIEASFTMEGGQLLPEPGSPEEEEWKLIGSAGS